MPLPAIVFSHANGFPAGTYRQLFETWRAAGHRVLAIERYGHDRAYPVTSNWPHLRDQLVHFIQREAAGEPVHLVGHSLGGFLSLMVASRQPEMVKALRLVQRAGPGRISQRRRWQWPSAEAAHAHFAAKHNFARWAPEVLADYIRAGTEPDEEARRDPATPEAVRLAFHREVETQIYNTLPHHLGRLLRRRPVRCPAGFVAGAQSVEVRQVGLAATRALVGERFEWVEGSHLFPMEKPAETAAAVLRLLGPA
jgi:pimeloyl-ACP methyl ester carboxylesterase